MTVRELINLLEGMDDEQEILFKPNNSWYPEEIVDGEYMDMRSFNSEEVEVFVLNGGDQQGMVD